VFAQRASPVAAASSPTTGTSRDIHSTSRDIMLFPTQVPRDLKPKNKAAADARHVQSQTNADDVASGAALGI
jgi:hypothetical protein